MDGSSNRFLVPAQDQVVTWTDAEAPAGRYWYLLKVIQADQESAWTSPIWIDRQ